MSADDQELLLLNDAAVGSLTVGEDHDKAECVVPLEPEITMQCEGSDAVAASPACETVCDIDATQRQLIETKENRDPSRQIPLPEGKEWHFFVSYSSDDRSRVLPIVAQLEQTGMVACILDERDFVGGMEIHENIRISMEKSMKVLLFLSERFLQSGFCNHERSRAFVMSMRAGRNIIIPVKLEECEVPSTLEALTYIEASTENLTDRIIEAYSRADTDFLPDDFGNARMADNESSFSLLYEDKERKVILNGKARRLLKTRQFQVLEETIQDVIDIINSYIASGDLSIPSCRICCVSSCIMSFIILAIILVFAIVGATVYHHHLTQKGETLGSYTIVVAFAMFIPLACSPWFVIRCYVSWRSSAIERLRADLFERVTLKTYNDGVLFKVADQLHGEIKIEIIRYDMKLCQKYLAREIKQNVEEMCENEHAFSMKEWEKEADQIMKRRLDSYLYRCESDDVATNNDGVSSEPRHTLKGLHQCFCEYLEPDVGIFARHVLADAAVAR